MSTNAKTTASRGRSSDGPAKVNPHAERIDADGFARLVSGFYGTKTLVFDAALAEVALGLNTGNRKVNRRKVEQLVRQMAAGEFEKTGEPVILSAEGILNNGQHRLLAVIEADAVVDMDVRFGIPRRAFSKTDTGAARTGADVLTIKGVGSGGAVSSALRLLVLYRRGLPEAVREFVSNDELSRAFDAWPEIEQLVAAVNAHAFPKPVRSTPLYATAFLASRTPAKAKLEPWLNAVDTGLDVARDNPAYQLRERLIRGVDAPVGTREGQLERFALMIKSWNLWSQGETVSKREFRWSSVGRAAEPFPVVAGARL